MSCRFTLLASAAASILVSLPALAGDCSEHPLNVFEVEIASCAPLDESNVNTVSHWLTNGGKAADEARPGIAKRHAGTLVLETTLRRSTRIHYDEWAPADVRKPPRVAAWIKQGKPAAYLFKAPDGTAADCASFAKGSIVTLSRITDCSCDTGPSHGTWCWLDGHYPVQEIAPAARALLKK